MKLYITISESLECDGGSISITGDNGYSYTPKVVERRRQYHTEYTTYEVEVPGPAGDQETT